MSTMPNAMAAEENHFLLILGKPGGGKGTISKKILRVSIGTG
jgi:energy-coupling factor transporter ATP-binding protein EcfA2